MRAYYYLFYKLYNFWEKVSFPKFWSVFKAGVSVIALEIWFIMCLINYYTLFVNRQFYIDKNMFLFIGILVTVVDVIIFKSDTWKLYNKQFNRLSKKKNIIGGVVVWSVIIFIIFNLIYSFYLMSQVDWKQYRYVE